MTGTEPQIFGVSSVSCATAPQKFHQLAKFRTAKNQQEKRKTLFMLDFPWKKALARNLQIVLEIT